MPAERPVRRQWHFDLVVIGCVAASVAYVGIAALAVLGDQRTLAWAIINTGFQPPAWATQKGAAEAAQIASYLGFAFSILLPVLLCWRRAITDGQLPARRGADPRYEHISGWGAVFFFVVILTIVWLVWWASNGSIGDPDAGGSIGGGTGKNVVIGLAVAFVVVASAPLFPRLVRRMGVEQFASSTASRLGEPVKVIGRYLSAVDSFFVYAVATAAGTNRNSIFLRYAILLSAVGACAILGYYWPAPWAFIPIAWGFIVAFSISRRWAWIEDDRELAMLNPTLSQAYIRVGFAQNLRDEALVAFMSMFLLVPLALMQAQAFANSQDPQVVLFMMEPAQAANHGASADAAVAAAPADIIGVETAQPRPDQHPRPDLNQWISFYGTELAKALPFVDWAEVYGAKGGAEIGVCPEMGGAADCNHLGQHAVFATRVLIDLVFLAALLQAIGIAARDAQQRDLFYKKRAIKRLDPFTEPEALRALVRKGANGEWEENGDRFDEFPKYDFNRLVELQASDDERVHVAANLLMLRDGVEADPHSHLSLRAANKDATPEEMLALVRDVQQAGSERNVYQLALARVRLQPIPSMADVRREIVKLIIEAPHSIERTEALIAALVGEKREPTRPVREIVLQELAKSVGINDRVRLTLRQVAQHDAAPALRSQSGDILKANPETPD